MLVLGWLPMVILTAGRGLKWVQGTGREVNGEDGQDGQEGQEGRREKRTTNTSKRRKKKILVHKRITQQRRGNGRTRTKTPIRVTADVEMEDDNSTGAPLHSYSAFLCSQTCRVCCCWSCLGCNYGCRRMSSFCCPSMCKTYDKIRVRPSIVSVFVLLAFGYGHYYLVSHICTDILHGFFIMSPFNEASKYFDANSGNYMGDLVVLENQAPIDALYEFASSFGTYGEKHLSTPILRRPRYWNLFHQLCAENKNLDCSRSVYIGCSTIAVVLLVVGRADSLPLLFLSLSRFRFAALVIFYPELYQEKKCCKIYPSINWVINY